jgi:DNA-binding SARP family transcriptional activator
VLESAQGVTAARDAGLRCPGKRKEREAVVLRVGVLGPVAAWDGDKQLQVGQPRQQAVLAILGMRANRVISRGELVDAVWGHEAPPSAEGSVYTYIAGLRRVLEPGRSLRGPGRILVSSGAGYVLHLVPGEPDAVSFEQLLHRARHHRKTGDLAGTVAALEAALGLWRGVVAFAGVPGPFAETERVRLGELRSAVCEERADALLALGRHEEVLADLTAMVADNPLRERMRALLMLALYRSGRQAEALRVFAEGRRVLAEELGIDPGAELSRIHQQVLTNDPALDIVQVGREAAQTQAHPQAAAPGDPPDKAEARSAGEALVPPQPSADRADRQVPVPAQLPPDAAGFSGRHEELGMLHGLLANQASDQTPLVVISGTAGVGKTALAIRFGRQVARRFPDGQLYLNLRGFDPGLAPLEAAQALRFILGALGVTPLRMPPDLEARAALFRSIADGKRMLVVLDNAASPAQVRPLLPGSAGTLVIVTSRNEMAGLVAADGAQPISLDVLSHDEARELLDHRLTRDRVVADPQAAGEIIESCARLPLALSIAVGRAAARPKRSLAQVAIELKEARGGLDALEEDDEATDVRAVFSWSYDQLSQPARRMFRLLGIHPGPDISLTAAASLAGVPRQAAGTALRELVRTHMVAEPVHSRYTFHDLLRAYAADLSERIDPEADRRAAAQRVLDHYLHSALAAGSRLQPRRWGVRPPEVMTGVVPVEVTDRQQATAWFEAECPVLLALIGFAESQGFDEHAWLIPWATTVFLNRSGRHQDWVQSQRTAVAAARRLGDRNAQAHTHYLLGYALSMTGDNPGAEPSVRRSLELFRELGDRGHEAMVLNGLAIMMSQEGRHKEALDMAQDGLRMVKAAGFWWVQGTLENTVGGLHGQLGEFEQGLEHCQRAIGLHREAGNFAAAGSDIETMGDIYRWRGDLAAARASYRQAIEVHRDVGAPFEEAKTLVVLGDTLADIGDQPAAARAWQDAEIILDRLAHPLADDVRAKLAVAGEHAEPDRVAKSLTTGR